MSLRPFTGTPKHSPSAEEVQEWLVHQVANEMQVEPRRVRLHDPILAQGIDSLQLVGILARTEDWLGIRFTANPLDEYPSIEALSAWLAESCRPRE